MTRSPAAAAAAVVLGLSLLAAPACDQRAKPIPAKASGATVRAPKSKRYSVSPSQAKVTAGKASEVALAIKPAPKFKINKEYSWSITFEQPASGATLSKRTFTNADLKLDDAVATVPLEVTVAKPGAHTLKAKADFSVCNDTQCLFLDQETLEIELEATP